MGVWQMKVAGEVDRERRMQQPRLTRYTVRARSIVVIEKNPLVECFCILFYFESKLKIPDINGTAR
jgi:hypothetical protein